MDKTLHTHIHTHTQREREREGDRERLPQCLSGKESTCNEEPQETQFRSLSWEDPRKEGMATHSSILAWRIPMDRGAW